MQEGMTLKGAPAHVKEWWRGTGLQHALFALVEAGASWAEAHSRLEACFKRHGSRPLRLLNNRRVQALRRQVLSAGREWRGSL